MRDNTSDGAPFDNAETGLGEAGNATDHDDEEDQDGARHEPDANRLRDQLRDGLVDIRRRFCLCGGRHLLCP